MEGYQLLIIFFVIFMISLSIMNNYKIENKINECTDDCKSLNMEYMKLNQKIFDFECWCKINNETKRIW